LNLSVTSEDLKGFWIALAISGFASFPIMRLLAIMKSKQTVSAHAPETHQVKQGTPTMGGLIILAGILGSIPFVKWNSSILPMAVLIVLFTIIGFVDDFVIPKLMPNKRGLGWKQKIIMQVVAAIIPLLMGGFSSPLELAIGTFVILFFANAYNFSDGLDGLAGTLLLGLLLGMFGIATVGIQSTGTPTVPLKMSLETPIIFVVFGAVIPFLFWNAPKAKVFMGDVGSLPIGAFLGGFWFLCRNDTKFISQFAVTTTGSGSLSSSWPFYAAFGVWSLMMVAELVPVPLQVASVKLRKKKIFPYTPIHHAFEKAGWPETRVVFVFALLQLTFSMLAISIIVFAK
jgi:phospho-N-acetylmuramoyl-pentapeptide-transferase